MKQPAFFTAKMLRRQISFNYMVKYPDLPRKGAGLGADTSAGSVYLL